MEIDSRKHKDALEQQIKEAYGRLVYTYTAHLKDEMRLQKFHRNVKYTQIALAAISTGGVIPVLLQNSVISIWIVAISSTILLGMNLYFKDATWLLDAKAHKKAANDLWFLREEYVSLLTDLDVLSVDDIMSKRDRLVKEVAEVYRESPSTSNEGYAAAQKALKLEEAQYFTSDELDQLLPEHLRQSVS